MLIRVVDFETSGFPEEGKLSAIIQAGWQDVEWNEATGETRLVGYPFQSLCDPRLGNPAIKIDVGAKATHHIIESDLDGAPAIETILRKLVAGADAFACHNKEHDGHYFTGGGKPFVCTLKAAQRVWPDMERHSNQFLRYALNLDLDRDLATPAHEAGPDAYVTAHLLVRLFEEGATLSDMMEWTTAPRIMPILHFGKEHRGKRLEEVPTDYLKWMWDKADLKDRDLKFTVRHHLDMRGAL